MPGPVRPSGDREGLGPSDRARLSPFEVATEVRMDATRHLTALAGDASMCAIGRSGRSFPAAKYHEGRQASAGQARRLLRGSSAESAEPSDGDRMDVSVAQALAGVTSDWQQMLADAEAKGPDWVAYATGGLDALAEISETAA